jgi:hypothetical protein
VSTDRKKERKKERKEGQGVSSNNDQNKACVKVTMQCPFVKKYHRWRAAFEVVCRGAFGAVYRHELKAL